LAQHHKYSITEVEAMYPFERDIYVGLLQNMLAEEIARLKKDQVNG
jgi:hypothetical protein